MINATELNNDIAKIIGDYQGQFAVEVATELKNSVLWLTSHYAFNWNTFETTNTAHTAGVISLPTNTAKILQIVDSDENFSYSSVPEEKFFLHKKSSRLDLYARVGNASIVDQIMPFILREDAATGTQSLVLGTLSTTPSTRTFNILYTKYSTSITDLLGLDRLYPYFLGKTVYNLLVKAENPDTALLAMYDKMATQTLQIELEFGKNRALQKYNVPAQSPHLIMNNGFSGI